MRVAMITPSFSRDHDLCVALCGSVDEFDRDGLEHIIVVPRAELGMFRHLEQGRRRVIAKEDVVRRRLIKLALPTLVSIPGIWHKRLRTLWITSAGNFVRGWVIQQVVKIMADRISDADVFVFLDSDIQFIRPFGETDFLRNGKVPLAYTPGVINNFIDRYTHWHDVACELNGIQRLPYTGDNYIATVVCWRRDRLMELQERIIMHGRGQIDDILIRQKSLSEYFIYGIYCTHVFEGDTGHFDQPRSLTHESWSYDVETEDGLRHFIDSVQSEHIAVLIQSTTEWAPERRQEVIGAIRRRANLVG